MRPFLHWHFSASSLIAVPTAASALTVTGISPATGYLGSTFTCDVYGTGFVDGTQVGLVGGGTTIEATSETFLTPGHLLCVITIPPGAAIGSYTLGVANSVTAYDYKLDAFTVLAPIPTITGISPGSAAPGETLSTVYVYGTDFVPGVDVRITGFQVYAHADDLRDGRDAPQLDHAPVRPGHP